MFWFKTILCYQWWKKLMVGTKEKVGAGCAFSFDIPVSNYFWNDRFMFLNKAGARINTVAVWDETLNKNWENSKQCQQKVSASMQKMVLKTIFLKNPSNIYQTKGSCGELLPVSLLWL